MVKYCSASLAILLVFAPAPPALAADGPATTQPTASATTQPADTAPTTQPSAEQVQSDLLDQLRDGPVIQPTRPAQAQTSQTTIDPAHPDGAIPPLAESVDIDMSVLGVAPGADPPKLLREGQYIVNRRGHLHRDPGSGRTLFVFEADAEQSPETPMVLVPCQTLQNMEDIVLERGQQTVFITSGQALVYRGVNFLLPTMMKVAVDRGNLH